MASLTVSAVTIENTIGRQFPVNHRVKVSDRPLTVKTTLNQAQPEAHDQPEPENSTTLSSEKIRMIAPPNWTIFATHASLDIGASESMGLRVSFRMVVISLKRSRGYLKSRSGTVHPLC